MKSAAILAIIAIALTTGCRAVSNKSTVNLTAGKDIHYHSEAIQEGTQAADKEVGDIAPEVTTDVKPGL